MWWTRSMILGEMRRLLERHGRPGGRTAIDGVLATKVAHSGPPTLLMTGTVFALVVQGTKRLALGDRMLDYGAGQFLVSSVDLPVTSEFVGVTASRPALGMALELEPTAIADLLVRSGGNFDRSGMVPGLAVSEAPTELLDASLRLLRLLDRPRDRPVLAPLIVREILWILMNGEQGPMVRQLGLSESNLSRISAAAAWIRDNYSKPLRVEDLAVTAGMSTSSFHRHFRAVTNLSPLQFQKQLRLQRARLLLVSGTSDVTAVAHMVGYQSPSQFSREYHRSFGAPPSREASVRAATAD